MKRSFVLVFAAIAVAVTQSCTAVCEPGTFGAVGSCAACGTSCTTCTAVDACTLCDAGFKIDAGLCVADATWTCAATGQYKDTDGACQDLDAGCDFGTKKGTCDKCGTGLLRVQKTDCDFECQVACDDTASGTQGCYKCDVTAGSNSCEACKTTHQFNGFTGQCVALAQSALCKGADANSFYFFGSTEQRCLQCAGSCKGCDGTADKCVACYDNYTFSENGSNCTAVVVPDDSSSSSGSKLWIWLLVVFLVILVIGGTVFMMMQRKGERSDSEDELELSHKEQQDTERDDDHHTDY